MGPEGARGTPGSPFAPNGRPGRKSCVSLREVVLTDRDSPAAAAPPATQEFLIPCAALRAPHSNNHGPARPVQRKMNQAKRAMKKMHIPDMLRRKVTRYLMYVAQIKDRKLDSATWLGDLSPYMQQEVHACFCEAALLYHPFFQSVHFHSAFAFSYVCGFTESSVYAPGDIILIEYAEQEGAAIGTKVGALLPADLAAVACKN